MKALQVGVIGVGRMGSQHAQNLAGAVRGAKVVALADVDVAKARRLAEELGVTRVYRDYRELLADGVVEAVVITGPTDQREAMLTDALTAKKPIFCEKPVALDLDAVRRIKTLANQTGSLVQIGFMRRFDPGYAAARQKIAEGAIGRPIAIRATSYDPYLAPYEYVVASGGLFADMSIHDFDLVRFLMADEVTGVYALGGVFKYERLTEFEDVDNALVTLRFARGAFGSVHGSRNAVYGYDIRTEILGTEGALHVGYLRHTPLLLLQQGVRHDVVPSFLERFRDAYLLELQAFVDAVIKGEAPPVGIEDGERALAIAVAARASLNSGRPEPVPL